MLNPGGGGGVDKILIQRASFGFEKVDSAHGCILAILIKTLLFAIIGGKFMIHNYPQGPNLGLKQ